MERQRIVFIALLAILASGCQQTEALFQQKLIPQVIEEITPTEIVAPIEEVVIEEQPITVWEYIQQNSQLENYTIDKTTQRYINNHLRDKKLFYRF